MSYNDRIDAALAAIKQHNDAVGEGKPGYLNPDDFIGCVKASGGTSEERLSALSHEDLLACMPASQNGVKPRVLAKEIADIFRNRMDSKIDDKRPISGRKAEKMTLRELVEAFDAEDYNNSVGIRLATISKKENFIVYADGRIVDVETTFKLLSEIKSGYPGRNDIDVNGSIKKVYKLGELPENYADENPLYRNRPLRPDGTCDQTGRSWEGVDLNVRQFIRVAMDVNELKITHEIAHDILDAAMESEAFKKLRSRYRKSAIKFDDLLKTGDLPTLKIPLNGGSEGTNPFLGGKQVVWAQNPAGNAYINVKNSQLRYRQQ
jgi:hypothetical protein